MSSSFADSFVQFNGDSPASDSNHSFGDGYIAPNSFSDVESTAADPQSSIYDTDGALFSDQGGISSETYANGPILPPSEEMMPEECYALREWRRQNAIRLEEKEKREKELLSQIIDEAEEFKVEFHRKMEVSCEMNRAINREKEKVYVVTQEKFHAEADKDYWKSIAQLIPKEVPSIEKKKGKKDQEKKPPVLVVRGPKPGKPTDVARMRQILIKLKHNTPPHLMPSPMPVPDAKTVASVLPEAAAAVSA